MTRIVVIGGGVAGLSAAAELATGADVTVLEAEDSIGYHASGRSAAMLEVNYGAPSVRALSHASVDYLAGHDGGYLSPRGVMLVAKPDEKTGFDSDLKSMGMQQISTHHALDIVPALNPQHLGFAALHAEARDIDTDRLLQGYARRLRHAGGSVLTGHKVSSIGFENGQWQIGTTKTVFSADLLVNAAGAWADEIARLAGLAPLGIVPHRRSMARVPAPDGADISTWPMLFGVGESWYAKPDAGCMLVSPADEDPVDAHDAWAEDETLAHGIAAYDHMTLAPVTRLLASWAGLRSFAPDRTLVLGPDPGQPAFIWCAGQGGYGMQTSPAAARLVADLVFDRTPDLPACAVTALRPERLR